MVAIAAVLLQRDPEGKPHIIEHLSKVSWRKAQRKSEHSRAGVLCHPIHPHGAAPQVPSVQHLRDALEDLHRPLQSAVPQIEQVTIGTDAVLVVAASQRENDFDITYRWLQDQHRRPAQSLGLEAYKGNWMRPKHTKSTCWI